MKFSTSILDIVLCLSLSLNGIAIAANRQDLKNEINALTAQVNKKIDQSIEVLNALTVVIAPSLSLTVGIVGGVRGTTVNVPVYFKSGINPVSAFQFDVETSTEIAVTSALPGISAQAAGKSVQGSQIFDGFRVLVFGLNSTTIQSGPTVILKVVISSNATPGKKDIRIRAISASSPTGTAVVLTGKNDPVIVQ